MSLPVHPSVLFPSSQRYPQKLQQMLTDRYRTQSPTVVNQGSSGEMAEDRGAQSRFSSIVSSRQYSVALIMEGTNDLYDRDDRAVPRAIDGLRQMIRDAKSRDIRPYLATIPPMNPAACSPVCRGLAWSLVSGFNDNVRELAASENVPLVDVYQGFGGNLALHRPRRPSSVGGWLHEDRGSVLRRDQIDAGDAVVVQASGRCAAERPPLPSGPPRQTHPRLARRRVRGLADSRLNSYRRLDGGRTGPRRPVRAAVAVVDRAGDRRAAGGYRPRALGCRARWSSRHAV